MSHRSVERVHLLEKIDSPDGEEDLYAGCMDFQESLESMQAYAMTFYEDDDDLAQSRTALKSASTFKDPKSFREKITPLEVLVEMYNFSEIIPDILFRPSGGSTRLTPLDGVRALAFLWVASEHLESSLQTYGMSLVDVSTLSNLNSLITHGELGVSMFFVLSGFLISFLLSRMYLRSNTINFFTFIYTRFLRIWPSYNFYPPLSILLVFATKQWKFFDQKYEYFVYPCINGWWTNSVFLTDFGSCFDVNLCQGHLWTVSTEFQMYLVTPILTLVWLKNAPLGCGLVIAGIYGSLLFYSKYEEYNFGWCSITSGLYAGEILINDWPIMRFAEYAFGMLAAFSYITSQDSSSFLGADSRLQRMKQTMAVKVIWHMILLGAVGFLTWEMVENSPFSETEYYYTIVAATVSAIMLTSLDKEFAWAISWFLGHNFWYPFASLSYTGYLWSTSSCPFAASVMLYFGWSDELKLMGWVVLYIVDMSICLAFAFVLSALVERPFMRLRSIIVKKDIALYRKTRSQLVASGRVFGA